MAVAAVAVVLGVARGLMSRGRCADGSRLWSREELAATNGTGKIFMAIRGLVFDVISDK